MKRVQKSKKVCCNHQLQKELSPTRSIRKSLDKVVIQSLLFVFSVLIAFVPVAVKGQLVIDNLSTLTNAQAADTLVKRLMGAGVAYSNATMMGVRDVPSGFQLGCFTTATTTLTQLGFSKGVVMATAPVSLMSIPIASDPWNVTMASGWSSCTPGEVRKSGTCGTIINDLVILAAGANYLTAAVLEFDFIPAGDSISFRYVFGSEEYADAVNAISSYECTQYNDKFGFLISGAGVSGGKGYTNDAKNIARLANGSEVGINSVNSGDSYGADSYCTNVNPDWVSGTKCPDYNGKIAGITFDGNTKTMVAAIGKLTAGSTYHIKLIVFDCVDGTNDSGVFIEGGSFSSPTAQLTTTATPAVICNGASTTLQAKVNYGTAPYTYTWRDGASVISTTTDTIGDVKNIVVSPTTTTTYTVTVVDHKIPTPTTTTSSITVTVTNPPTATINYAGAPFCKTLATAQAVTLTGTGSYTGGTYSVSPSTGLTINATTGAITPSTSTAGDYTVTYTTVAAGGCSVVTATANVTITAPPAATISYAGPFCNSIATPQTVILTGTTGGAYTVSPAGLSINATTGAITPSTSTAANYVVTYTIAANGGCAAVSDTAKVTINAAPTASLSYSSAVFCTSLAGAQSATLTGTGSYTGGSYSVSPTTGLTINASTGAITPSTSTAGPYVITYSIPASGGCSIGTATANVTISANPAATISYAGSPFCSSLTSQSVSLTGTTGGTYAATPSGLSINATSGSITPGSSTGGTYVVTYTIPAAGGCALVSDTANVTITTAPTASISYVGAPFCSSLTSAQAVTLTGTTGGTYTATPSGLSINASTGAITPSTSTANSYVITYLIPAAGGCALVSDTANVTVTTAPTAVLNYSGSPFCTSLSTPQTVSLTGTTGGVYTASPTGLSINSSTGAITPNSSSANAYVVTYAIPAAGGCALVTATANITITQAPIASIIYSGSPFCSSLSAPQAVSMIGTAGGAYTVVPTGLTLNASSGAITPSTSTAGNYTVTYTIPASGGCASVLDTAYVTVTTAPTATISYSGSPYCTSELSAQTVNLTGTSGGVYNASPSGLSISSSTGSITPSASTPGSYTISYSIAAAGGCPLVQAQTAVTINGLPTITISGTTALCTGGTTTLTATGATSYAWSNGDSGPSITVTPLMSSNIYTVTGTQFGCVNTATTTVVVNSPPTVVITGTDTICFGGTTTLTASGASSYLWSHNGSASNSITVFPQATTTYTVSGTTNGCTSSQSYTVVVLSKPVILLTTTDPGCNINNGVVQSVVSGGMGVYTYSWSNGSAFSAISNLAPGSYILTVSDGYCSSTASATLLDPNNLKAAMYINPQTTNILEGDVVFKDVSEGNPVSWIWSFGDGTASSGTPVVQHHYSELGTYLVQLIIQNFAGCSDTIQDTVVVEDVFTLYIPNALSVDNNTTNDGFSAYGNCVDPTRFKMDIYDRWGGLLFTANQWVDNKSFPAWNGCKNNVGVKLPLGVYVYRITVADVKGRFYRKVGSVSIVK